jgi:uncharacterized membrane protein
MSLVLSYHSGQFTRPLSQSREEPCLAVVVVVVVVVVLVALVVLVVLLFMEKNGGVSLWPWHVFTPLIGSR